MNWRKAVSVLFIALLAVVLLGALGIPVMAGEAEPTTTPTETPTPTPAPTPTPEPTPAPADDAAEVPGNAVVRNLKITPIYAWSDQAVTITAEVANNGQEYASLTTDLYINGQFEQTASVGVSAGTASTVSFTVYRQDAGQYNVALGGASGVFYVSTNTQNGSASGPFAGSSDLDSTGIIAIAVIGVMVVAGLIVAFRFS